VDVSQLLSRLLRSKNPDDLIAANRLIKNVVKQVNRPTAISVLLYASIVRPLRLHAAGHFIFRLI